MGVTLKTVARNAACNAIVDLIDAGTGAGELEIQSAQSDTQGVNEVATLVFSATAFGNAATGVATAAAITGDSSAVGGTAAAFTIFDGDGTAILSGTVGTSGADINLTSTTIAATESVDLSSLTVTVPAAA